MIVERIYNSSWICKSSLFTLRLFRTWKTNSACRVNGNGLEKSYEAAVLGKHSDWVVVDPMSQENLKHDVGNETWEIMEEEDDFEDGYDEWIWIGKENLC
jgi:hypothetical protein